MPSLIGCCACFVGCAIYFKYVRKHQPKEGESVTPPIDLGEAPVEEERVGCSKKKRKRKRKRERRTGQPSVGGERRGWPWSTVTAGLLPRPRRVLDKSNAINQTLDLDLGYNNSNWSMNFQTTTKRHAMAFPVHVP